MVNRTIQYQNGSFFIIIPKAIIDIIGLKAGDKVTVGIENNKITIASVHPPSQPFTANH